MLPQLDSIYDVYILDTFSRGDNELTYKVLLLDNNFSRHADYVAMCDKEDILQLLNKTQFDCHNFSRDSGCNIWLSTCKLPQNYMCTSDRFVSMPHPKTLWEFLWDAIISDVAIYKHGDRIPLTNLAFSMSSDGIYLTDQTGVSKLLWTISDSPPQECCLNVVCDDSFYHRWSEHLQVASVRTDDGFLNAKVNLYAIPYTYEGIYSSCRFCNQELVFLVEKYLLLKAHLHGVELGHWFMQKLNDIDSKLFGFIKPYVSRSTSLIAFRVEAEMPNALLLSNALSDNLDKAYDFFRLNPSLAECLAYFGLDSQVCNNCYYAEFFKGFLSQISGDPSVIRDHEYLNAELLQKDITALACRIFVYRLVMLRRLRKTEQLYLSEGILRMEVVS